MVLSDSENEDDNINPDSTENARTAKKTNKAIVVALPQGEAQVRIDALLDENKRLAAEIVELRQIALEHACNDESVQTPSLRKLPNRSLKAQPTTSGVASIFEKNKELESKLKGTEERIAELEANHSSAIRSVNAKQEKELRKIKYEKKYV
jgi:hypothetical protein